MILDLAPIDICPVHVVFLYPMAIPHLQKKISVLVSSVHNFNIMDYC